MRAKAEERAQDRRQKAEDCRDMAKCRKKLVELMVGIALGYFALRGGGGVGRKRK